MVPSKSIAVATDYTLTYNTKTGTLAAVTYAAPTQTATAVVTTGAALTSYGFTEAQANDIVAQLNQLRLDLIATNAKLALEAADNLNLRQILAQLITDLNG